jgi:hypothetical protein
MNGEDVFFGRTLDTEMDVYLTADSTDLVVKVCVSCVTECLCF